MKLLPLFGVFLLAVLNNNCKATPVPQPHNEYGPGPVAAVGRPVVVAPRPQVIVAPARPVIIAPRPQVIVPARPVIIAPRPKVIVAPARPVVIAPIRPAVPVVAGGGRIYG